VAATSSGEETPASDSNALVNIDVRLLDDSPDQYRLVYPKDEIEELAMLLKAGQTTPIRIRPKANGRFEIITGHRRTRAAPIAGLTHLLAMVVEVDDKRAAIELMVDNEAQEGVGDFERAKGYQTLVNKGMTQNEVAEAMGINKSLVSKRLSFLKLPSPVIEALATHPRAYSWNTVEKILPLLNETPELTQFAAEGTHRVGTGEWSHQTFVAQMYQQQKKKTPSTDAKSSSGFAITDSESRPILTMKSKPKGRVEIQLASDVDQAVFMTRLNQMLRDEASKPDSDLRRQEQRSR
jgi:ParB family chromosome partitioning protein